MSDLDNSFCVTLKCQAGPHIGQKFRLEPTEVSKVHSFTDACVHHLLRYVMYFRMEMMFSRWVDLLARFSRREV